MESKKISFTNHGERFVTVQQLIDARPKNMGSLGNWHTFTDGWMSTSKKTPMNGGIFMDIVKPVVVQFKDKYRRVHTGILTEFSYDKSMDKIHVTVRSTLVNMFHDGKDLVEGTMNYQVSINKLTIVSGIMPKTPKKPTFIS